jgi:hypothetical protein
MTFVLIIVGTTLVLGEIGARVVMAFRLGPSVLLYGTRIERSKVLQPSLKDAPWHEKATQVERGQQRIDSNGVPGYLKYRPHQQRFIRDALGERHQARINSRGFRGDEFETAKAPGVYRIVALGASSTFGYHDRDDETYPVYLEGQLNDWLAEHPQPDVERFAIWIGSLTIAARSGSACCSSPSRPDRSR